MKLLRPRLTTLDTRIAHAPPKVADRIYQDPRYKRWRDIVIQRARGVCQWPGCGRRERRMFADHKVELRDGGAPFDPQNGQCLCGQHHSLKTAYAKRLRQGGGGVESPRKSL